MSSHQNKTFYDQVITDYYDLMDRVDFMRQISPSQSLEWDDTDYFDAALSDIFEEIDLDLSFLPPERRQSI